MTLQELRKRKFKTIKAFAEVYGCSASKAGMILQGRHIRVYHDEEIDRLAQILDITFERCWLAMCESYNQFMHNPPGMEHQRADEVRAEVQTEMQEKMPDLNIKVKKPREMTVIEAVLVVPEKRRLGHATD